MDESIEFINEYDCIEKVIVHDELNIINIGRVLEIKLDNTIVELRERCDGYFTADFNKENLQKFINSLQALCNKLQG